MKYSLHARQRMAERFSVEIMKAIEGKLERNDYIKLPSEYGKKFSLVRISKQERIIVVWTSSPKVIVTVFTVDQYLKNRNYLVSEDVRDTLSELCGIERNGGPLKFQMGNLMESF